MGVFSFFTNNGGFMKRKEQVEETQKKSQFALARAGRTDGGEIFCKKAEELLNDDLITINADDDILFITDNSGEIIHELNRRNPKAVTQRVSKVKIDYVNGHNIIFTTFNYLGYPVQTTFIKYHKNDTVKKVLYDSKKGARLNGITIPNKYAPVVILSFHEQGPNRDQAKLFSCERGKFISPTVSRMQVVSKEHPDILRFEDDVYSNKKVNGMRHTTMLTGFIRLDGIIANSVYDHGIEKEREIGIKSGNLTEGYKSFRNRIKLELDYQFEIEKQDQLRQKKHEDKSLAKLYAVRTKNDK